MQSVTLSISGRAGPLCHIKRDVGERPRQRTVAPGPLLATRRDVALIAPIPFIAASLVFPESVRAESTYMDPEGFSIAVPDGWTAGQGEANAFNRNETRRVLAWYPDASDASRASVSVIVTNVAADFTALGSFGSALAFGENLVAGLDRSYQLRQSWGKKPQDVQTAKLIDAREDRGMYSVEYTLKRPGADTKRLYELVALGFNGTYNRLYTVTAQCKEDEIDRFGSELKKVVASFVPPKVVGGLAMKL